jgi:sigma-B regulation protein RsbU (phosphoserine phosphatase)
MQRRYRLNRLGNPEINLLAVGTDEDIRATLDSIRNRYYAKDPSPDPDYHSFSTEENEYVVSVRTLFMKPEISERAIVILSTEDSRDSQVWRRYRSEEAGLNRELQAIIAQLRAIRDSAEKPLELYRNQSYRSLYKAYDDIRQRKGAALERAIQASLSFDRQSLESLQERKKEMESAVEETEANIQSLQEEFEAARQSPEASPPPGTGDEEETESNNDDIVDRSIDRESQLQGLRRRIEEEKKAREALEKRIPAIESQLTEFFPRSSRVADAYLHLPDALLYDRAVMEFVYDPTAYMSYVGSIRNREDRQKKWNALRLWIQTACSETTSCGGIYLPFVAGNGQLIRPRYALEEVMWQFDTMPSDDLSRRALFENTAAFTRIFSDRGELDQSLRKERHRLVDMAVAVGLRLLLVALLISLFFVKRIKAIIASAERVGAGDLSTVFHYPGNDELGNLAGTLNKMTQDLRHRESMIQELSAAEQIQNQLLPAGLPERFAGALDFGSFYRASSGVGGDYFDFIEMDESRLAFCIADVTGHGPGPAMIMAMMRSHLHTLIQQGVDDPGKLLRQLNGRLYQETPAHVFITMFLAIFNRSTNTVKYGSAGHNRGYVYRKSTANVETLSSGGLPLGLEDEETFDSVLESHSVQLNNGDLLFQYTDGINEAVNVAGVQFGTDRIERILKAAGTRKPETIMASMVTNLERFTERKVMKEGATELSDDIAMILIRRR